MNYHGPLPPLVPLKQTHPNPTHFFSDRLDPGLFPVAGGGRTAQEPPAEVIFFYLGGTTYEESLCVAQFNQELVKNGVDARVILGGTTIHSSQSFLDEVAREGAGYDEEVVMMDGPAPGADWGAGDVRSRKFGSGRGV